MPRKKTVTKETTKEAIKEIKKKTTTPKKIQKHYVYSLAQTYESENICNSHGFIVVDNDILFSGKKNYLYTKLSDTVLLRMAIGISTYDFMYDVVQIGTEEPYEPFYDSVEASNWDCKEVLDNFYHVMNKLSDLGVLVREEA